MQQLLSAFLDIIMLRRGPQDLPASQFLMVSALLCYTASGLALFLTQIPSLGGALAELSVVLALEAGFFVALLALQGKLSRAVQTLTALWGTGTLLTLVGLPLHMWIVAIPEGAPPATLPNLGVLLLLILSLVVAGHILREALELPLPAGILLVMSEFILSVFVTAQLFGGGA